MSKQNRKIRKMGEIGNTTPPSPEKQPKQLKKWCFTYNNYTEENVSILERRFKDICTKFVFQRETGAEGTRHLQGCLWLIKPMRWTEFNLPKLIHWEKMNNEKASAEYCQKAKSADEGYEPITFGFPKPIKTISSLYPWQAEVLTEIDYEPNGRRLLWIYDEHGNVGKSAFCKYLYIKHKVICIQGGKLADIMNIIFNLDMNNVTAIAIDVPRKNRNHVSYAAIECILNGMITNTKYETGVKCFNPPHVIVFSNYAPEDDESISEDRWDIREIVNKQLIKRTIYL